jgi:hypothetical protein
MYQMIGGDGKEYGPISPEQLQQWIKEGRANAQTQLRAEGTTEWKALGDFPEFAAAATNPPPLPAAARPSTEPVPTYLAQSILVTLFCCLPFGIAAIVFAAQVNSKLQAGDVAGARESSRKAKKWCWWSVGAWVAMVVIYFLVFALFAVLGVSHSTGQSSY